MKHHAPWARWEAKQRRKRFWRRVSLVGIVLTILLACSLAAFGADARDIRVIDGDSFDCQAYLGFGVSIAIQVRIEGFDAWETSTRRQGIVYAPDEMQRGDKATAFMRSLLSNADHVGLIDTGKTSFDRKRCWVYVDGKEVGALMRAKGFERHD